MYIPSHFAESDPGRISRLVDAHPLATLVTQVDGRLEAHHLPFLRLGQLLVGQRLVAHAARGNPVWRLGEARADVLLVFAGAEAYVSPAFYPGKAEHHRVVPTFNYAAVHLRGELSCSHDKATKLRTVEFLTKHMEAAREAPWSVSDAPPAYVDKMLDGIVALSFEIRAIEAKFKASQNKSEVDRRGVVAGLRPAANAPGPSEAAELIEQGLPRA
ncbi:MAG TPA: FMN-binding negative transcriptional regulator [Steroidobacteraceae bacterium]|nr:FMN-binding negative transcriptional regulator [Steroidobacteraceae bacterium]